MSDFLSVVSVGWGKVWPILFAILFFGLIIVAHEFGHFIFAKLFDVKVNKFAIGMGPAIFKKTRGETEYSLRLFPVGGFVAMEGEDEESEDERAFGNKKVWKRMIVVAAGAVINLLLGLAIVIVLLSQEDLIGTCQINRFFDEAVTSSYGLKEDDIIKEINGRTVFSEYDLSYLLSRDKDGNVDFVVERGGEKLAINGVQFNMKTAQDGTPILMYDFVILGEESTFINVVKHSVPAAVSIGRIVWISLFDLVTGNYSFSELSGPIGTVGYIAEVAQQTTKTDLTPILTMLALVSINIGIFNLLPVPALDGGRLLFLFIELLRRKPINPKYENWIHAVGLVALLLLMVAVSSSDIIKLARGDLV